MCVHSNLVPQSFFSTANTPRSPTFLFFFILTQQKMKKKKKTTNGFSFFLGGGGSFFLVQVKTIGPVVFVHIQLYTRIYIRKPSRLYRRDSMLFSFAVVCWRPVWRVSFFEKEKGIEEFCLQLFRIFCIYTRRFIPVAADVLLLFLFQRTC